MNPTLEVSSNKISSHVPTSSVIPGTWRYSWLMSCWSKLRQTGVKIGDLYGLVVTDFVSNYPRVWIFPKFLNLGLLLERTPPPKRPSLMKEMTFRICAVITLGITWCSLSWNMDTRSIAKLWRISWKQTFWALLSIATQATWWKRPYPTALLRPV